MRQQPLTATLPPRGSPSKSPPTSTRTTSTSPRRSAVRTVPTPSTIPVNMVPPLMTDDRRDLGGPAGAQSSNRGGQGQGNGGSSGTGRSRSASPTTDGSGPPNAGRLPRPPSRSGARNSATWSTSRAARNEPRTSEPPSTMTLVSPAGRRARRGPRRGRRARRTRGPPAPRPPRPRGARRRAGEAPTRQHEHRRPAAAPNARGGSWEGSRRRVSSTTRVKGRRVRGEGSSSGSSARTVSMPTSTASCSRRSQRACRRWAGLGDPLRVAGGGGDATVEGQRGLEQHERAAVPGGGEEALVEPRGLRGAGRR